MTETPGENPAPSPSATPDDIADTAADIASADDAPLPSSETEGNPPTSDPAEPASMADAIEAALNADPNDIPEEAIATEGEEREKQPTDDATKSASEDDEAAGDKTDEDEGAEDEDEAKAKSEDEAKGDADPDEPGKDEDDDPTDEELKAMRPGPRRRIKQLLSQRNAARSEAEALKGDAQNYQAVREYMSKNGLDDREVADLFQVGADLKSGDPKRLEAFIERVQPMLQMAMEAVGRAVPQDLQSQVNEGEMSEEAARELARNRHAAQIAAAQAQRLQQTQQQGEQARQRADVVQAVNGFLREKQASDPDYARKTDVFKRVAQGLIAEKGRPATSQAAVQMAQEAWDETNRLLQPAQPKPRPTRPTPATSSTAPRSGATPAPSSLADIIDQGLRA